MTQITVAQAIARVLERMGTEVVFGVTISIAPGSTTCGMPRELAACKRSGPALKKPPHSSSASSVVVKSSTASITPCSTNSSMARPPVPLAWKTKVSQSAFVSKSWQRIAAGVVAPKAVIATVRRLASARTPPVPASISTMPQIAAAPFINTLRRIGLIPIMSNGSRGAGSTLLRKRRRVAPTGGER